MEVETNATEGAPTAPKSAKVWHDRLAAYREKFEGWHKSCENAAKLYSKKARSDSADREYSIFWANIEVLKPATYARTPAPVVAPRFKDSNPIAREASEMLERSIVTTFEQADVDDILRESRDEFLMYSRGTAWVRLLDGERVEYDHVNYDDFAHDPARKWREVKWVARRAWLSRDEGLERFGEAFQDVPMGKRGEDDGKNKQRAKQAAVWEIWCKASGAVYWVNEDTDVILDEQPPMFELASFWPCPRPAYGTIEPKSLVPVPEIKQYKDQIEEINEYTSRIAALSEALKAVGFYAAGQGDVSSAVEQAFKTADNRARLVPISSFAALGGSSFKDSIVWWPVEQVILLVKELVGLRRVLIEDVYQITGISDIVRGQSDPNETMGAQKLKSQWGSMRIRERQQEIARFARDITRITGELLAEQVAPETLKEMAQSTLPTAQQKQEAQMMAQQAEAMQQPLPKELASILKRPSFEEVAQFLANDRVRGFVIEIETDSTIQPDEDAEKQRRIEFVTSVGGLIQQVAPLVMQMPQMGPMAIEVMKFAAAGFRAGRPLEAAMDEFGEQIRALAEQAQQPTEPPPDPAVELKKAELELKRQEAEARLAMDGQKLQFEQEKAAAQIQIDRDKMAAQMEMERDRFAAETEMKREFGAQEIAMKREFSSADVALRARSQFADESRAEREYENKQREAEAASISEADDEASENAALLQGLSELAEAIRANGEDMVKALTAPRRKSGITSSGKRVEIIDEAVS